MIHIHQPAKWMRLVVGTVLTALVLWTCNIPAFAAGGLEMSTDYPGIVVKAGDSVNFSISFSNDTGAPLFADLRVHPRWVERILQRRRQPDQPDCRQAR